MQPAIPPKSPMPNTMPQALAGSQKDSSSTGKPHRVVIVGGGFGGLKTAVGLRKSSVQVTLVDRRNFHLFQPLLYQVATGTLSPANIASPLRSLLHKQRNARVLLAEAVGIDAAGHRLLLRDGELPYDTLVLATGTTFNYFGHDAWHTIAPGLKTIEDATDIRRRVLTAFERAERETDPARRTAWLTFAIIGGGPTGVELAGSVADMARHTLRHDFRSIDPSTARVLLLESQSKVLGMYPDPLPEKALQSLGARGIEVHTGALVTDVRPDGVTLKLGDREENIECETVLWTAGVKASPLGKIVAEATGATTDRIGRVMVEPDLTVPGFPDIFVIGDLAHYNHQEGQPLPGLAQVAMQEGTHVAETIRARISERRMPPRFRYFDKGSMATIGPGTAVADIWGLKLCGHFAWLMWLCVHLMYIAQFHNRVLVIVQWAWSFLTRNRSARLITGGSSDQFETLVSADQASGAPKADPAAKPGATAQPPGTAQPQPAPVNH